MTDDLHAAAQRKLNFLQTLKAVLWALFGVRKASGQATDVSQLNPVYLIIAGLLTVAIFVIGLLLIVRWAVASLSGA